MLERISNELIYRITELKEKVGTWRETGDILDVSPRTLRRWRKGKVSKTNKDISEIKDKLKYTQPEYNKTDIYENEKVKPKYSIPKRFKEFFKEDKKTGEQAIITLHTVDYAKRDKDGRWRAGRFADTVSDYKRGQIVGYEMGKKLQKRGKKDIQLINKARQFRNQKDLTVEESLTLAKDWQRDYRQEQRDFLDMRDSLYYLKSGLRVGEVGAELLNDYYNTDRFHKGQRLSKENQELIESMSEIPYTDMEGLSMYVDEVFGLKPSE